MLAFSGYKGIVEYQRLISVDLCYPIGRNIMFVGFTKTILRLHSNDLYILCVYVIIFRLSWDTPLNAILGEDAVKFPDPRTTDLVTLRDLVLHRSGLPAEDLLWYSGVASRENIARFIIAI